MSGQREPVGRAIEVLHWLADHPRDPWSIRQIAREMNTSPTTVHRIFGIFEGRGLLQRDESGGYLPSIGLYALCHSIAGQDLPVRIARPLLDELAQECDETVMLGAYDARLHRMMYVAVRQVVHPVQQIVHGNTWRPIHAGATGLAILAFLCRTEREVVYREGLTSLTDRTITDVDQLEAQLATIRDRGYAHTKGHHVVGAVGFAAPVFDTIGNVYGDVCITVPGQRFDDTMAPLLGKHVVESAETLSRKLRSAGFQRAVV